MAEVPFSEGDYKDLLSFRNQFATPTDAARKVADLEKDNQKERDKVRDLTEKVKLMPADGAVVLTGDDAAAWPKYQALGKVEDLEKLSGRVVELEKSVADSTRKDSFAAAVKALKWPDETVATLLDMNSLNGAVVEVKTEKATGKDGKAVDEAVPYVTLAGEGEKPQKFAEFAANAPQLKGIKMAADGGAGTSGNGIAAPEMRGSTTGSGPAAVTGGVDDLLAANQKAATAPNPLRPAQAA